MQQVGQMQSFARRLQLDIVQSSALADTGDRKQGARTCTRSRARSASRARTRSFRSPLRRLATVSATSSIMLGPVNRLRTARFCAQTNATSRLAKQMPPTC